MSLVKHNQIPYIYFSSYKLNLQIDNHLMSCVRAILPKAGFVISFIGFSYLFLNSLVLETGSLLLGIILVLTSSFLILTFSIIQYLECRHSQKYPSESDKSSTCESDKECFMKLWNAGKEWNVVVKVFYYGLMMPVIIFVFVGLALGVLIYFFSGVLIFYLIIKYCMVRRERNHQGTKYESDSSLDISNDKK